MASLRGTSHSHRQVLLDGHRFAVWRECGRMTGVRAWLFLLMLQSASASPPPPASPGWTLIADDTYEAGFAGWPAARYTCGSFGTLLGRYGSGGWVEKTYSGLPSHTKVRVQLFIAYIDSWDGGEFANLYIDTQLVWSEPSGADRVDVCGGPGSKWGDYSRTASHEMAQCAAPAQVAARSTRAHRVASLRLYRSAPSSKPALDSILGSAAVRGRGARASSGARGRRLMQRGGRGSRGICRGRSPSRTSRRD